MISPSLTLAAVAEQGWEVASVADDRSSATLVLRDSEETRAAWPHKFEARYTVRGL